MQDARSATRRYYEYTVMPPEGLYGTLDAPFCIEDEGTWIWKMAIRQPDFADGGSSKP